MRRILDTELIRPSKFAHVVLRTRHLEASVEFYQALVGMEIVHRNDFVAFMTFDEEHHRLALVLTPQAEPAPKGAAGMDHMAYSHRTLGDLLASYKRLKAQGIEPVWSINHGPTTSLYYEDPDGNRAELQVDNFETEAALKDWMRTGAFQANPIGVEFDADKLLERYERGDPIEELVKQGSA